VIRVIVFLVVLGALALGAGWVADQQGSVTIVWLGRQTTTTIGVMIWAFVAVAVLAALAWSIVRAIMRAPGAARARRAANGMRAVSHGLLAVGAGDARAAARHARDAKRLVGRESLVLLLDAQAAQLRGDRAAAEHAFGAMTEHHETRLLGLRGLFIEAQRKGDLGAARRHAEEAAQTAPAIAWSARALLEMRCAAGDWAGALAALDRGYKAGLVDKDAYRRQRAVLLTGEAQALAGSDREAAKTAALEAVKLAPDLVPAAALAGTFLAQAGEPRRAGRIVDAAWRANPHPDLADVILNLRPGESSRQKLDRIRKLAQDTLGNVESALALARAAITAHDFALARSTLAPLLAAPTQRVATLMAELEEKEHGDIGRAREWMARALTAVRDPAWSADGFVSERWLPVSPSGRLDAFEWKVPLAEVPGPVIEPRPGEPARELAPPAPAVARPAPAETAKPPEPAKPVPEAKPVETPPPPPAPSRADHPPAAPVEEKPSASPGPHPEPDARPLSAPPSAGSAPLSAAPAAVQAAPVIPLMHAPDDPGLTRNENHDADAEPRQEPKQEGWWRTLFG
jgi:HemY protein